MDFYAYQAAARSRSRVFVGMFAVAVAFVVIALDTVIFTVLAGRQVIHYGGQYGAPYDGGSLAPWEFARLNPGAALAVSLLIAGVIGLASLFKASQLRGGGAVVAQSLGGVRVERDTADPARQRLRNIVEEMAIASGVPVPEIYVLERSRRSTPSPPATRRPTPVITVTREPWTISTATSSRA